MTLTEFLLARIDEDEANLPTGNDCWYEPERYAAECEAKRQIVNAYPIQHLIQINPSVAGPELAWTDDGSLAYVVGSQLIPVPPQVVVAMSVEDVPKVLRLLALPYADHPDYRSEWAL